MARRLSRREALGRLAGNAVVPLAAPAIGDLGDRRCAWPPATDWPFRAARSVSP